MDTNKQKNVEPDENMSLMWMLICLAMQKAVLQMMDDARPRSQWDKARRKAEPSVGHARVWLEPNAPNWFHYYNSNWTCAAFSPSAPQSDGPCSSNIVSLCQFSSLPTAHICRERKKSIDVTEKATEPKSVRSARLCLMLGNFTFH